MRLNLAVFSAPRDQWTARYLDQSVRERPGYVEELFSDITGDDLCILNACLSLEQEWEERGVEWPS